MITTHPQLRGGVIILVGLIFATTKRSLCASLFTENSYRNQNESHYLLIFENSSMDGRFLHVKPFLNWEEGILTSLEGFRNFTPQLVCLKGLWVFYSQVYLTGDNEMIHSQQPNCYTLAMGRNLSSVRYVPTELTLFNNLEKKKTDKNKLSNAPPNPNPNPANSEKIFIFRRSILQSYFGEENVFSYNNIIDKDVKILRSYESEFMIQTVINMFYIYYGDFSQIVVTGTESSSWTLYDRPNFGINSSNANSATENRNNMNMTSVCLKQGYDHDEDEGKNKQSRRRNHRNRTIVSFSSSVFKFNVRSIRKGCHSMNVTRLNRQLHVSGSGSQFTCKKTKTRIDELVGSVNSEEAQVAHDKIRNKIKSHVTLLSQLVNSMQLIVTQVCGGKKTPSESEEEKKENGKSGKWVSSDFLSSMLEQFVQHFEGFHVFNSDSENVTSIPSGYFSLWHLNLQACSKQIKSSPLLLFSSPDTRNEGQGQGQGQGQRNKGHDKHGGQINGFIDHHGNKILLKMTQFIETVELTNALDPIFESMWLTLSINFGICASLSSEQTTPTYLYLYENFINHFIKPLSSFWIVKAECGVKNLKNDENDSEFEKRMLYNLKVCNAAVYMNKRKRNPMEKPARPIHFQWQNRSTQNRILVPRLVERNIIVPH